MAGGAWTDELEYDGDSQQQQFRVERRLHGTITVSRAVLGSRTDKTTDDCDKDDAVGRALTFALDKAGGLSVHHGGNNVLFMDGHVAWKRKFDTTEMTLDPRQMLSWGEVTGKPESGDVENGG